MNDKIIEETGDVVQGIEMIDLGNAMVETKQGGTPAIPDSCCTLTFDWMGE